MKVFGRIGQACLLLALATALAAIAASVVLSGHLRFVTCLVLGIVAVVGVAHGVTWTLLQRHFFGRPVDIDRVARCAVPVSAQILSVTATSSAVNHQPIAKVCFGVGGTILERRILVPFNYANCVRPGSALPVRFDPAGTKVSLVDWASVTA